MLDIEAPSWRFSPSDRRKAVLQSMLSEYLHSHILELERQIDASEELLEKCRKGMQLSRLAIVMGSVIFAGNLTGLIGYHNATLSAFAIAAAVGGTVWLGANRSTKAEAQEALTIAVAERARLIDEMRLQPVDVIDKTMEEVERPWTIAPDTGDLDA